MLISQLDIREPRVGELIEARIAANAQESPEALIWMARSAHEMGATFSRGTYRVLENTSVIESAPREWLAIMLDTTDGHAVDRYFRKLPKEVRINAQQAGDLIRLFKRQGPDLGISTNGSISTFLDCLPVDQALEVAGALEGVIGPSFKSARELRTAKEGPAYAPDDIFLTFKSSFAGLDRVTAKTKWSLESAQAAA